MQDSRYSRQVALPGFGHESQSKLAVAKVLVIGAGGLGSAVIPALAAAGVGTIGIVDDDRVELSNLHRQLVHTMADVGRSKAHSAASAVAAIDPAIVVTVHDERLTAANALEIFAAYDHIVDGSDNFATRYLANDAAAIAGIPLVWGAVSQYGGQAGVAWAARGPHYRDLFPVPPAPGSVLSCEEGGVMPTVVATIGSIMATETIKLITGIGHPLVGRVTTMDALSGQFRELAYESDPIAGPITELIDYDLFCGISSTITAAQLQAELADGAPITLVDVREPWEAEIATLPGAKLVPLGSFEQAIDFLADEPNVVLYCHHGVRSQQALDQLTARGVPARHLGGGIDEWSRLVDPATARY
jgi:molybdopterin/thiamine biosynthesis adenylyltransferase/rhodanese-related sulfurtransferase